MNPGSSKPLDEKHVVKNYRFEGYLKEKNFTLIPTKPDSAQYQIMRLMELNNWNFVRILNLSDLRNGNSSNFKKEFKKALDIDTSSPHCITHPKRKQELKNALISPSLIRFSISGFAQYFTLSPIPSLLAQTDHLLFESCGEFLCFLPPLFPLRHWHQENHQTQN